jgi:hypothetical protein
MTHLIKVTNKNDYEIVDYFDGIPYVFATDKPVNVPIEAMRHIFGMEYPADEDVLKSHSFREEAFHAVSKRWGWNAHDLKTTAENRKKFNNILFTPIVLQQVELVAKTPEIAEPREQKPLPAKGGKFKPRADEAEETSEEGVA